MKKVLLAVIIGVGVVLSQSVYAGLARITTVAIDEACYETTSLSANPIVAKVSECDPKEARIQTKVIFSTVVPAYHRDDGALVVGYTVYTVTDQDNVMHQIKVSDVSL